MSTTVDLRPTLLAFSRSGVCRMCGAHDSYYMDGATDGDDTTWQCVSCGRCATSATLDSAQRHHWRFAVQLAWYDLLRWVRAAWHKAWLVG